MSILIVASAVTGCASTHELPLVFGQSHTVGISMGASATDQGGEFTLGYRDRDVAIVPVVVSSGSGAPTPLSAQAGGHVDALSVLGQFQVDSDATARKVGLGKFFATGMAAKVLADGFSAQLSGQPVTEPPPAKVAAEAAGN